MDDRDDGEARGNDDRRRPERDRYIAVNAGSPSSIEAIRAIALAVFEAGYDGRDGDDMHQFAEDLRAMREDRRAQRDKAKTRKGWIVTVVTVGRNQHRRRIRPMVNALGAIRSGFRPSSWAALMRHNAIHVLIGLVLGAVIIGSGAYVSARWNDAVVFEDVQAAVTLSTREHVRWLAVRYHVVRERLCPSWSQHVLYRDNVLNGAIQRNYVPLAITANGLGASPASRDFAISFRLPDDLMPGTWHYTVVTSASCEWLPGLQRESVTETQPVGVDLPR